MRANQVGISDGSRASEEGKLRQPSEFGTEAPFLGSRTSSARRFTEVFCEMLCQAIGKSGPRLDIPLMLYQSSTGKKARRSYFDQGGEDEELEEEGRDDGGKMLAPSPPPPPPKRSHIEGSYLNTAKWRTRRDEVPEKIDYCL
ncbi:hypothetical protein TSMEX_010530 [Taenia solium]|eukprot:TsM_000473300 transcript=TsM_000473300 gene=TsM_000473300